MSWSAIYIDQQSTLWRAGQPWQVLHVWFVCVAAHMHHKRVGSQVAHRCTMQLTLATNCTDSSSSVLTSWVLQKGVKSSTFWLGLFPPPAEAVIIMSDSLVTWTRVFMITTIYNDRKQQQNMYISKLVSVWTNLRNYIVKRVQNDLFTFHFRDTSPSFCSAVHGPSCHFFISWLLVSQLTARRRLMRLSSYVNKGGNYI